MKISIIIILLLILIEGSMVYAKPFLYCDPIPINEKSPILHFELNVNDVIIQEVPPRILTSGYRIEFDLKDFIVDVDKLDIKARAFNGLWSEWSNLIIIKVDPPSGLRVK